MNKRIVLRNILAFAGMVAVCGALFLCARYILVWLDRLEIGGLFVLILAFIVDAYFGVLGYFAFAGDARLRTVLVFFSVIAFGAVAVLLFDPGRTFYPLLTSVPFAAIAGAGARATGLHMEKRRDNSTSIASP